MESGFLIYKCRRCEKLNKTAHAPNGLQVLSDAVCKDYAFALLDVCNCKDGGLGIADLIGFEKD